MISKLKNKFDRQGFLVVRNVLDFNFDLKPVLNDIEFIMNRLVYKFVSKKKFNIVLKYNFWKKYTFLSKLNIKDFDQFFNIRLPKENIKKESDFFASQSIWNLIKNKNILNVIEKLIGSEISSNPVQNFRIKQPEKLLKKNKVYDGLSGRTPWHQDAGVLSKTGQKYTDLITCWIPFTKTIKKNGCMLTIPGLQKKGLFNHDADIKGQALIRNSELLDKYKTVALEANLGDIVLLSKHTVHCSLPNISNNFRISMDLRYHKAGQPSGRDLLPSFYVRSKNKKNIKVTNYKQWISIWEKAKHKCVSKRYTFKYQTPTFKGKKRDLVNLI
jgi:phytanoyl-CoA hydroxylase